MLTPNSAATPRRVKAWPGAIWPCITRGAQSSVDAFVGGQARFGGAVGHGGDAAHARRQAVVRKA
jgi:hypothetical protein